MQIPAPKNAEGEYKLNFSIKSLPSEHRESYRRTGQNFVRARGVEDTKRARPSESTKRDTRAHRD